MAAPWVKWTAERWFLLVFSSIWALVGAGGGWIAKGITSGGSAATFETPGPVALPEKAFPGMRVSYAGSGSFRVPSQAPTGTYIVTASGLTFGCSWQRLSAGDGRLKSVIASGVVNRGEFGQFTVGSTDRALRLDGDCMVARS